LRATTRPTASIEASAVVVDVAGQRGVDRVRRRSTTQRQTKPHHHGDVAAADPTPTVLHPPLLPWGSVPAVIPLGSLLSGVMKRELLTLVPPAAPLRLGVVPVAGVPLGVIDPHAARPNFALAIAACSSSSTLGGPLLPYCTTCSAAGADCAATGHVIEFVSAPTLVPCGSVIVAKVPEHGTLPWARWALLTGSALGFCSKTGSTVISSGLSLVYIRVR
jgi:hypothetical protein